MSVVPMLAGVGLLMVCCSSSSVAATMMGGEETPDTTESTGAATTTASSPAEVFWVGGYDYTIDQAAATCTTHGASVATDAQLTAAQTAGADWCATGWLKDKEVAKYPITTTLMDGCGNGSAGIKEYVPPDAKAGVNCYGIKPTKDASSEAIMRGFTATKWSRYD